MKRYSLFVAHLSSVLMLAALAVGCGGSGGSESRSPIPTVGGLALRGAVTVRVSAVGPREASLEAETPVADANVIFTVEGEGIPLSQTRSDANGNYLLPIRAGIRGRVTVLKDNRQLSAIVLTNTQTTGTIERDVNLESTVVEVALRNQNTLSYDVLAMEEAVRIGEAQALLDEIKSAFKNNRAPSPTLQAITEGLTKLQSGEQAATHDCLEGQEWCAVISNLEAATAPNTYTAHLLLRRDRTDGNNSDTTTATVGAGHLVVQVPAGFTLASISGSSVTGGNVIADNSDAETGNTYEISFLYEEATGIGEAAKLADLTLTATRDKTAADRVAVTEQRLLGVLNERRGGAARDAKRDLSLK